MKAVYDESIAQLRMRPHTPWLDGLPTGGRAGTLIIDPAVSTTKQRIAWVTADETRVDAGVDGISRLKKGSTCANVLAARSQRNLVAPVQRSATLASMPSRGLRGIVNAPKAMVRMVKTTGEGSSAPARVGPSQQNAWTPE